MAVLAEAITSTPSGFSTGSAGLAQYEALVKEQFFDAIAEMCSVDRGDVESRFGGIKMNRTPDINGHCVSELRGGKLDRFRIELYHGVLYYPFRIAELLATRTAFGDFSKPDTIEQPTMSLEESIRLAKKATHAFWSDQQNELEAPIGAELSPRQLHFSMWLTTGAFRYVVGHEFGHAAQYLATRSLKATEWANENAGAYVAASGILKRGRKNWQTKIESSWRSEIAADIIGTELSIRSQPTTLDRIFAYVGAEYMLMLLNYLQTKAPRVDKQGSVSHPPFSVRVDALRNYFRDTPDIDFKLAEAVDSLAQRLFFSDVTTAT